MEVDQLAEKLFIYGFFLTWEEAKIFAKNYITEGNRIARELKLWGITQDIIKYQALIKQM